MHFIHTKNLVWVILISQLDSQQTMVKIKYFITLHSIIYHISSTSSFSMLHRFLLWIMCCRILHYILFINKKKLQSLKKSNYTIYKSIIMKMLFVIWWQKHCRIHITNEIMWQSQHISYSCRLNGYAKVQTNGTKIECVSFHNFIHIYNKIHRRISLTTFNNINKHIIIMTPFYFHL